MHLHDSSDYLLENLVNSLFQCHYIQEFRQIIYKPLHQLHKEIMIFLLQIL